MLGSHFIYRQMVYALISCFSCEFYLPHLRCAAYAGLNSIIIEFFYFTISAKKERLDEQDKICFV